MTVGAECDRAPRYVHGKRTFFSIKTTHKNSFSMNKTFVASKICKKQSNLITFKLFYYFLLFCFVLPVGSNNL